MNTKLLNITILCIGSIALNAHAGQPIPALEAFKRCDLAAMPKAPIKLPGGLVIKSIKNDPATPDQKLRIVLRFNMTANPDNNENQTMLVKRLTGYDFSKSDDATGVVYEQPEMDPDNYLACTKQGK